MRQPVLVGISLLALAACTPQPSLQAEAGTQPITPTAYAAGSPSNTTRAFDGTFTGVGARNIGQGNTLAVAGRNAPITCQDYGVPPPLTIHNGLAHFQLLNYTFQGYVTPQGHLKIDAGYGQTLDGQIDNQGFFRAQVLGACVYNLTWRRSSGSLPLDAR
jgi:hypothetical protein